MARKAERYVEMRDGGNDPVGSFGARRISQELRDWVSTEAKRTNRTQRQVMEDALESFIKHRKVSGPYKYENLPRNSGGTFRMFIRLDLLYEALELVKEDRIFNGDLVNAAIKFERAKSC